MIAHVADPERTAAVSCCSSPRVSRALGAGGGGAHRAGFRLGHRGPVRRGRAALRLRGLRLSCGSSLIPGGGAARCRERGWRATCSLRRRGLAVRSRLLARRGEVPLRSRVMRDEPLRALSIACAESGPWNVVALAEPFDGSGRRPRAYAAGDRGHHRCRHGRAQRAAHGGARLSSRSRTCTAEHAC